MRLGDSLIFIIPYPPFSEQADIAHPAGKTVYPHDDGEVDHIQAQADGGSVGVLGLLSCDTDAVHIDAEDIRGGHVAAGLQEQRLVRVGLQQGTAVQDQHHDRNGNQMGDINMLDLFPAGGAVNGGGFVQLGVNAGQRGNIENRVPARVLPDVRSDEQRPEPAGFHNKVDAFSAGGSNQVVDDAVGWGKKEVNHSGQHHGGNEVRHIDRSLGKSLEALAVQLIQQDGQYDRDGIGNPKSRPKKFSRKVFRNILPQ